MNGLPRDEDPSTFREFETNLVETTCNARIRRKSQLQTPTSIEAEMRKVSISQFALKRFECVINCFLNVVRIARGMLTLLCSVWSEDSLLPTLSWWDDREHSCVAVGSIPQSFLP